jgi:hypothetical protein
MVSLAPALDSAVVFSRTSNNAIKYVLVFPKFSGHASITPQKEQSDAGDDHGEENSPVHH